MLKGGGEGKKEKKGDHGCSHSKPILKEKRRLTSPKFLKVLTRFKQSFLFFNSLNKTKDDSAHNERTTKYS